MQIILVCRYLREPLLAGLVGQWWHGAPVRCQGNWQWMNSTEVGAESDLCLLVA